MTGDAATSTGLRTNSTVLSIAQKESVNNAYRSKI